MRFRKISSEDVKIGQDVRITLRHPDGWPTLTYQGPVNDLVWEKDRQSIIGNNPLPDRLKAIVGTGNYVFPFYPTTDWHIVTVEAALPPLPTTAGSVVLKDGRAAVLRHQVDEEIGTWYWADTGTATGPVLGDADIVHVAPRR